MLTSIRWYRFPSVQMLKIKGHSGCILEIISQEKTTLLRKTSHSHDYSPRKKKLLTEKNRPLKI